MQGRVISLLGSLATAAAPVGLLLAGPLSDRVGVRIWYIVGGLFTIAMGLAGGGVRPLRELERHGTVAAAEPSAVGMDLPAGTAGAEVAPAPADPG